MIVLLQAALVLAAAAPARARRGRRSRGTACPCRRPASAATASIVTQSAPRSANSSLGRGEDLVAVARRVGAQRRLVLEDRQLSSTGCGQRNATSWTSLYDNRTAVRFLCYSTARHRNGPQSGPDLKLGSMFMSTTAATAIPAGTYTTDGVHSSAGFAVKHMLATFRGSFGTSTPTLTVDEDGRARLDGTVPVDSVVVKDENLAAHLQSPEFFDAEQYPEIRFESDSTRASTATSATLDRRPDDQGPHRARRPARGYVVGPVEDPFGNTKLGLQLETDRRPHQVRPELERAAAQGRLRAGQRRHARRSTSSSLKA